MARKSMIKPSHRGRFTNWAKAHHMTVSEAARKERHAGGKIGKEASFAYNAEHGAFKKK